MTAYVYCGLFICFLWSYDQGCFERAWMGMNETCVKSIDSEQILNGNEWDRGTRKEWHCVVPCRDVAAADHRCGTGGRYCGLLYLQRCAGGWCRASWHDKLLCPIGCGFSLAWYYTIRDTDLPLVSFLVLLFYSFARNFMRKSFGEIFLLEEL